MQVSIVGAGSSGRKLTPSDPTRSSPRETLICSAPSSHRTTATCSVPSGWHATWICDIASTKHRSRAEGIPSLPQHKLVVVPELGRLWRLNLPPDGPEDELVIMPNVQGGHGPRAAPAPQATSRRPQRWTNCDLGTMSSRRGGNDWTSAGRRLPGSHVPACVPMPRRVFPCPSVCSHAPACVHSLLVPSHARLAFASCGRCA